MKCMYVLTEVRTYVSANWGTYTISKLHCTINTFTISTFNIRTNLEESFLVSFIASKIASNLKVFEGGLSFVLAFLEVVGSGAFSENTAALGLEKGAPLTTGGGLEGSDALRAFLGISENRENITMHMV